MKLTSNNIELVFLFLKNFFTQSAGIVEYTNCTSADIYDTVYDTKQSDGEVAVMLRPWRIRSTPSLPLFPGPHWPGVLVSDRALSMG